MIPEEFPDFHGDMPLDHSDHCMCGTKCKCKKECECESCGCLVCSPVQPCGCKWNECECSPR